MGRNWLQRPITATSVDILEHAYFEWDTEWLQIYLATYSTRQFLCVTYKSSFSYIWLILLCIILLILLIHAVIVCIGFN